MNLQYYYNYVTIVEEGSLSAAAKKLGIAQPALSTQIKALEEEYNTRLFFRGSRRIELTDTGIILFQKAQRLCELETKAKNEIANSFSNDNVTLCFGVTSSLATNKLFTVCTGFLKANPDTNVRIVEDSADELMQKLQKGQLEAILVQLPYDISDKMEILYRADGELVALYSPQSDLFMGLYNDEVDVEDLEGLPLALVERIVEPVQALFAARKLRLNIKSVSSRLAMALNWVKNGQAVALVSKDMAMELGLENLAYKTFREQTLPISHISLIAHKQKYRSPLINAFLSMLSDAYGWDIGHKLSIPPKTKEE